MQKAVVNCVRDGEYSTIVNVYGTTVVVETCWFPDIGPSVVVGRHRVSVADIAEQHIAVHRAEMGVN